MNKRVDQNSESGWVLVIAMVVMVLILGMGLAILSNVDNQQKQGLQERVRESSFNLGEATIYSQSQILARAWPTAQADAFPSTCNNTLTTTVGGGTALSATLQR